MVYEGQRTNEKCKYLIESRTDDLGYYSYKISTLNNTRVGKNKTDVIHDGIDTNWASPKENVSVELERTKLSHQNQK